MRITKWDGKNASTNASYEECVDRLAKYENLIPYLVNDNVYTIENDSVKHYRIVSYAIKYDMKDKIDVQYIGMGEKTTSVLTSRQIFSTYEEANNFLIEIKRIEETYGKKVKEAY